MEKRKEMYVEVRDKEHGEEEMIPNSGTTMVAVKAGFHIMVLP